MADYYDGTKALSMKDLDGNQPEIIMVTTNRSAGKTTYYDRYALRRFLKYGEKFCLIVRFDYELDGIAEQFFKDIGSLFFPNHTMKAVKKAKGVYVELYVGYKGADDVEQMDLCGYAVALNKADALKKKSHLLSDISRCIFDEFQSETNHYCSNEIAKFMSVHDSLARGHGEQAKFLPVIMISNPVSIINPYYTSMGISARLDDKTKFLRGHGYILEQGFNESASQAIKNSGFHKAFEGEKYDSYSTEAVYLNDSMAFIEKPEGKSRYLATLKYDDKEFAIREYDKLGILYVDDKPDVTYPLRIAVTTDDHNINYVMLRRNDMFISHMRYFFEKGCFRFKDLQCKDALMTAISY